MKSAAPSLTNSLIIELTYKRKNMLKNVKSLKRLKFVILKMLLCRGEEKLYTSIKVGHSRTSGLFNIRFGDYTVIVTTTLRDDI